MALHEDSMKFWLAGTAEEPSGECTVRIRKRGMR